MNIKKVLPVFALSLALAGCGGEEAPANDISDEGSQEVVSTEDQNQVVTSDEMESDEVITSDDQMASDEGMSTDEELTDEEANARIEELLQTSKDKVAALSVVKEMMPESYNLHQEEVDQAMENAQMSIENAESYLGYEVETTEGNE